MAEDGHEPDPDSRSSMQRTALSACAGLCAWASAYSAAQIWYTIAVFAVGKVSDPSVMMTSNFVSVNEDGTLSDTIPSNIQGLINWQYRVHQTQWRELNEPPPTGWVVALVRGVDAFADGLSFFSSNLGYSLLISAFMQRFSSGVASRYLYGLLCFSFVATIACVLLTVLGEVPLEWLLHKLRRLTPTAKAKIASINEWYIGQWAWLVGFAYWTTLLQVITKPHLDCYDSIVSWWILCVVVAILGLVVIYLFWWRSRLVTLMVEAQSELFTQQTEIMACERGASCSALQLKPEDLTYSLMGKSAGGEGPLIRASWHDSCDGNESAGTPAGEHRTPSIANDDMVMMSHHVPHRPSDVSDTPSQMSVVSAHDSTYDPTGADVCVGIDTKAVRNKVRTLCLKSCRWVLGIGLYFTCKQSFPRFKGALSQMSAHPTSIIGYTVAVTAVCGALAVLLEWAKEALERRVSENSMTPEHKMRLMVVSEAHELFKLALAYTCGKAWEAFALGVTSAWEVSACVQAITPFDNCACAVYWCSVATISVGFAMAFVVINIKVEFSENYYDTNSNWPCAGKPGHVHGQFCVCIACEPTSYPIESYPGHDYDGIPSSRDALLDIRRSSISSLSSAYSYFSSNSHVGENG